MRRALIFIGTWSRRGAIVEPDAGRAWRAARAAALAGSRGRTILASLVAVGLAAVLAAPAGATRYTITDIGTIPGGDVSWANGVNASSEVVGTSRPNGAYFHAFSWTPSGGMVDLGTFHGGAVSHGNGVNDSGEVVGMSEIELVEGGYPVATSRAFSYTPSEGMANLGTLPRGGRRESETHSEAYAVNDSGEVVGISLTEIEGRDYEHAFSYTPLSGMVDLGTLPGTTYSEARGVNDSGEVVGTTIDPTTQRRAFSYTPSGGMVELSSPCGSEAYGVNDSGEVVGGTGFYIGGCWPKHAFSYTPSGGMVEIPLLPEGSGSEAFGVSDRGEVVGGVWVPISGFFYKRAFSYTPSGGMVNLGTLPGGGYSEARGVNASGEVVGWGSSSAGSRRPFAYTSSGGIVELPGGEGQAYAVNDSGQIVGWILTGQAQHAALWTPQVAPEFGRCLKVVRGKGSYASAKCITSGTTNSYEWFPAFGGTKPLEKRHFTTAIKPLTEVKLETKGKQLISCTGESGTGEYSSVKSVAGMVLVLTGCHRGTLGSCQSEGSEEGRITSSALTGELGIIATSPEGPAKNKIGLDLRPASGETLAAFSCAGVAAELKGSVIVEVKRDAMLSSSTLKFTQARGVQKPTHFEGRPEDVLRLKLGTTTEQAGLALTTVQTNEEKVEVNSVF